MAGELVTRHPHPALRGLVRAYHGYSERTPEPVRRRELPGARAVLILGLGPPLAVQDPAGRTQELTSFAAGLHTAPAFTGHLGTMEGVQVVLTPLGARRLLGRPMSELSGVTVDLDDLLGVRARDLAEAAAGAGAWDDRFELVERSLMRWAEAEGGPPPEMAWAYGRLLLRPVHAIAGELGWSQRRLRAAFLEHVGLRPGTVARLLRFERAVALLRRGHTPASAAHGAGYADQPHMTREFRRLAGATPAALLAEGLATDPMRSDHSVQDGMAART